MRSIGIGRVRLNAINEKLSRKIATCYRRLPNDSLNGLPTFAPLHGIHTVAVSAPFSQMHLRNSWRSRIPLLSAFCLDDWVMVNHGRVGLRFIPLATTTHELEAGLRSYWRPPSSGRNQQRSRFLRAENNWLLRNRVSNAALAAPRRDHLRNWRMSSLYGQ